MRFNRRSFSLAGLTLMGLAVIIAACTDDPTGPGGPPVEPPVTPPSEVIGIPCRANIREKTVVCDRPDLSSGGARAAILIQQRIDVELISSNRTVTADTFAFDVEIRNPISPQPLDGRRQILGTNGTEADSIYVSFRQEPIVLGGTGGSVTVANRDGVRMGTNSAIQSYFAYGAVLDSGQVSQPRRWKMRFTPGVEQFSFLLEVDARMTLPTGWVDVVPDSIDLTAGSTTELDATARNRAGQEEPGKSITWTSLTPAVATVDGSGVVTAVSNGVAIIRATTPTPDQVGEAKIVVGPAAPDTFDAISNVPVPVSAPALLDNGQVPAGATVDPDTVPTDSGGVVAIAANGSFTYLSRAGFAGLDGFSYKVIKGSTTLNLRAVVAVDSSNYWYVQAGASGDGRKISPFGSVAAAQAATAGPGEGDSIFVLRAGVTQLDGPVQLEKEQALIGEGTTIPQRFLNGDSVEILARTGSAPGITRTGGTGPTVTLAENNILRGVAVSAEVGSGIAATNPAGFGTLFVRDVSVQAGGGPTAGPSLLLSNGALDAVFVSLSSTGSTANGLSLTSVTGTLTANGGSLRDCGGACFSVSGGTANVTYAGKISDATGPAVELTNRTGGTVTLSDSIINGQSGIIVTGNSGGAAVFSGVLAMTGTGVTVQNNTGGTVSFTGAKKTIDTAAGASGGTLPGVVIASNTGSTTVEFGGGNLSILTGSGAAFSASGGGTVAVTGANNIVSTASGTAVNLDGVATGAAGVTFERLDVSGGAVNGIRLNAVTGAGFQVTGGATGQGSGGSIVAPTGHAVSLTTLGATPVILKKLVVSDAGAGGNAGIFASSAGSVTVDSLDVSASGGPALSLSSSTLGGLFTTLTSSNSASSALILNGVGGAIVGESGSLTGAAATTVAVIGGAVDLTYQGSVAQANNAALLSVTSAHSGDLSFTGAVSATNGTGLQFNDADGSYAFTGITTLNGGNAGVDVIGGSGGVFSFASGASIVNPTGELIQVANSAPTFTYGGSFSKTNAGVGILVQSSGGTVTFNGDGTTADDDPAEVTKTLTTTTGNAVNLLSNTGTVSFQGGGLNITTTTGVGFNATGGGTVSVNGAGNTATTTTGTALLLNGINTGATGVVFASLSSNGAASGLSLDNLTGSGVMVNGGTIAGATGFGVSLQNLSSLTSGVQLNNLTVNAVPTAGNAALYGSTYGTLTVAGVTISAVGGSAIAIGNGTLNGTFASVSSTNSPATAIGIQSTAGTATIQGGTVSGVATQALSVISGTLNLTFSGSLSKTSGTLGMVSVGGGHTGTLAFNTGTLQASAGTGLTFTAANGTYNFNGTTTLAGGDAGIDINGASTGSVVVAPAGGHTASITSPSGTAIDIAGGSADLTYSGNVTQATASQALLAVSGGHSGDVDFVTGTLSATNGTGVVLDNADGTYDFDGTATFTGGARIQVLNGSGAAIDFGSGTTVTNPTNPALHVSNGGNAANVTFAGSIGTNNGRPVQVQGVSGGTVTVGGTINATGQGILVSGNTGGTIAFSGAKTLNTGANAAVTLTSNTGAVINFAGGGLDIDTNGANGITGTGGGTLQVTGNGNSVNATNGVAISLDGVSIGASAVNFQRIDASGGSNGIFLKNTGSTNGLQVTGTGAAGSGGNIQNTVGADGTTAGVAVYLENVRNVVLKFMTLNNHPGFGVRGIGVNGLTVDNTVIAGTQGTNGDPNAGIADDDESAVSIINLSGTALFTNDSISGGIEDNVRIMNAGVTSDSIVFTNTRIGHANTTSGNTAVLVRVADGAVTPVRVRNSTFHGARNNMFHLNVVNTATADLVMAGNTFHNTHPNILSGGGGVALTVSGTTSSAPVVTYNINGNSIRGARGVALNINKDVGLSDIRGTVTNNVIGQTGVANSGSTGGSGLQLRLQGGGTHRAVVTNNQIRQYNNYGLILEMGDAAAGGGHGRMDVTMTGNTIKEPGTSAFPINAVHANIGTVGTASSVDQHILCLNASGNNVSDGAPTTDVRLRQRFQTTFILQGYGGGNSDNTAVNNFFAANNPGSPAPPTAITSNSVGVAAPNGPGNGFINGTCLTP